MKTEYVRLTGSHGGPLEDAAPSGCFGKWRQRRQQRERERAVIRLDKMIARLTGHMNSHGRTCIQESQKSREWVERIEKGCDEPTKRTYMEHAKACYSESIAHLKMMTKCRRAREELTGLRHTIASASLTMGLASLLQEGASALHILVEDVNLEDVNAAIQKADVADKLVYDQFKQQTGLGLQANEEVMRSIIMDEEGGSLVFPDVPTHVPVMAPREETASEEGNDNSNTAVLAS